MANCHQELNTQIKGLQARLSQVEDNITNHFVGVSTAIMGLLANPLTAGSVASVAGIYNLVPAGMAALQQLVKQIGALDPKKIMMEGAVGMLDSMETELAALASMIEDAAADILTAAEAAAEAAVDAVTAAVEGAANMLVDLPVAVATEALNLTDALVGGVLSEIESATNALHSAMSEIGGIPEHIATALSAVSTTKLTADTAKVALDKASVLGVNAKGFFGAQQDISKCKSSSVVISR
jgi:predicted phage tail protein